MIFKIEAPVGRLIFCIKKQLFTNMAIIGGMPGKGAEGKALKGIVFGFFVVKGSETSLQELNFTRRETKLSIKSRRLFAILVITAMVLAMLPMTAFAQEAEVVLGATDVEVDETDLAVGEKAKVTMTFYDLNGKPLENGTTPFSFYIKTSRSKADQVTTDDETKGTISPSAFSIVGGGGTSVSVEGVEGGQVSFYISSNFVGSSTITFWDGKADVDGSEEFGRITLNYSAAKYDKDKCELTATDTENEVTTTGAITMAIFKNLKLEAEILTESGVPVKGETVTFQKSREGGAWTTIASKATDVLGKASINTTESVAGKYEYRARIGGTTVGNTVKVTFTGTHPTAIKAETADGGVAV